MLKLQYIPLDQVVLWADNPKSRHQSGKHLEALIEGLELNGFRDPPGFDPNLNKGKGGIAHGNTRLLALRAMRDRSQAPPKYIALDSDEQWLVPVVFGADAGSEAAAMAYAISHNNLSICGMEGFTAQDTIKLWDEGKYKELLEQTKDFKQPGMSQEEIDSIIKNALAESEMEEGNKREKSDCIVTAILTQDEYDKWRRIKSDYQLKSDKDAIAFLMQDY